MNDHIKIFQRISCIWMTKETVCYTAVGIQDNLQHVSEYANLRDLPQIIPVML